MVCKKKKKVQSPCFPLRPSRAFLSPPPSRMQNTHGLFKPVVELQKKKSVITSPCEQDSQPPWRVDTKTTSSPACSSYASWPSSSQSASLMRTKIPGRLHSKVSKITSNNMMTGHLLDIHKSSACSARKNRENSHRPLKHKHVLARVFHQVLA
jgi:hypothetical protein